MLAGVQIICFTASYTAALALEASRMVFRSGVRGALMLGFAGAGLVAHTAFLAHRAAKSPGSPLSSEQDWCLVAAWLLVVVYLYLVWYHPRQSFGLFLLPLVLGLIGAGKWLARGEPFAREPASRAWGLIHGSALLLATVAVLVGFAAGLMYLYQDRRLKRKLPPPRGLQLPSLEWLARVNARALVAAVLMLLAGVGSGMVLNAFRLADGLGRLPLSDPVVLATLVMLLWLLSAVAATARYPAQRQGRRVVYLTLVSFVFLLVALAAMLLLETAHGGKNEKRDAPRVPAASVVGAFSDAHAPARDCQALKARVMVPRSTFRTWSCRL